MKATVLLSAPSSDVCIVGTGLISLDVVLGGSKGEKPRLWAGGTCGNVLSILSYMGWKAVPLARMGTDPAAKHVRSDLQRWGVDLRFASLKPRAAAPIIIQRIRHDAAGRAYHAFSFTCPDCGAQLPRYKPVFSASAAKIVDQIPAFKVLFLDRVSRVGFHLAQLARKRDAIVVFEPSGVGDQILFSKILNLSHVFKYSHQRFRHLSDSILPRSLNLEVETLGRSGLRYRANLPCHKTDWRLVEAYGTDDFKDASGAGDWCTAGILHAMGRGGLRGLKEVGASGLHEAFSFGQALAAWNCRFEGARGGMYEVGRARFKKDVTKIMFGRPLMIPVVERISDEVKEIFASICASCSDKPKRMQNKAEVTRKRSA